MKLALIILGLFFLSLTVRSRELNLSERVILSNYNKTVEVKSFMETKIIKTELSMRDYIGFLALRKSCDPVRLMIGHIKNQEEDFKDQAKILSPMMLACQNSVIGLGHLYIGQQED